MDDENDKAPDELLTLRTRVASLEKIATEQHRLAEAYRAQINAIILILKSPVS
jgi:hypothetical protein